MTLFHTRRPLAAAALFVLALPVAAEPFADAFPEVYAAVEPEFQPVLDKIDLKHGMQTLEGGIATVDVPADFYFLDAEDSKVVLEDIWENPPGAPPLGMLFPAGASPLHDAWGVSIEFDPMGYVSDEDAADYDYDALLGEMQADTREENKWRAENGYGTVELLGWAEPPHYDSATRELYWAKRLSFSDAEGETLNYNIRELGRKGVLVVNFIAGMEQLEDVREAVPDVRQMISFTEGNRYADYQPGVDAVAAVGIGGLIAGKVLSKAGLLAVLLVFLKKGGFLLLLPISWVGRKLFGRGGDKGEV